MAVRLSVAFLLLACGAAPPPATAAGEPTSSDPCAGRNGLVLELPVIESEWHGAYEQAGEADARVRWCGPGELVLGTAHIAWPALGPIQDWERAVVLAHGEADVLRLRGARGSAEATLHVRGMHEGVEVNARGAVRSVANRARAAALAECVARSGTFRPMGMLGLEDCDAPTRDAGRPCRASAECESFCVADEAVVVGSADCAPSEERIELRGHCFERTVRFGCHAVLAEPTTECRRVGSGSRLPTRCTD